MKIIAQITTAVVLLIVSSAVWSAERNSPTLVLVTGEHWLTASDEQKYAYLFGIGNVLQIERAMHINAPTEVINQHSIVPVLVEGLSHLSLEKIKSLLDDWYAEKADQTQRSVIEVLYVELALPNATTSKK